MEASGKRSGESGEEWQRMVTRYTLQNGLTVLINEDHASPVVAVLTHVKTGYFNEEDRLAGISHLLEHMYFKGTPRRPGPEDIAQATKAIGGILNAFTYYEETGYYTVAPADRFTEALDIQADALAYTKIDADELKRETEVVLQEGEQKRDSPWAFATEELFALAYDQHRIRRWRIGEPDTLRAWTREEMLAYYRGTYHPENMILVISGDVEPETAMAEVRRQYGGIVGGPRYISPGPSEDGKNGPRYRQVRGDIRQRLALLGFHTVPVFHPDSYPLDMLSLILSDGRSSRLYQSVREQQGLASVTTAYHQTFSDIGYFILAAESIPEDIEATERALWAEIARLQETPPDAAEMDRIKTRTTSRLVFDTEEPLGRARRLATFEALGGYELEDEDTERLLAVTPEDVQRVARAYFTPENAALLEYVSDGSAVRVGDAGTVSAIARQGTRGHGDAGARRISASPRLPLSASLSALPPGVQREAVRLELPGGGVLSARSSGSAPVIALEMLYPGGRRDETDANAGITYLMLRSILKGNAERNGEQIAQAFEGMGSSLEWLHGLDFWGFGFHVLGERFGEALALAADVITTPAFSEEDIRREKETLYADIRRAQDNGTERALDLLDGIAYAGHPYAFPERGTLEGLQDLGPDELRAWHAERLAAPLIAGAGGALDPDGVREALSLWMPSRGERSQGEQSLGGWRGIVEKVERRERKQTSAAMGFPTVNARSEDRFALDTLAQILSGLGGRLFAEVRGRRGLAYTVAAWHTTRQDAGLFVTYTATAPENEDEARDAIFTEYERLRQEPVTSEELDRAKAFIAGAKLVSLQTSRAQARDQSRAALYGRPAEASRIYVERIQALTAAELQQAAQRYFDPDHFALGILRGI